MDNVRTIRDNEELMYILPDNIVISNNFNGYSSSSVVIIFYLYYLDTVENYLHYIKKVPYEITLYIVTGNELVYEFLQKHISLYRDTEKAETYIIKKKNRGYDVSALLVTCREIILRAKYFCFVHDKKAKDERLKKDVDVWIRNMWSNLVASSEYIYNVLSVFENNEKIGVLTPPEPLGEYISAWYNKEWYGAYTATKKLADSLKLEADIREEFSPITLGTAFWGRTEAVKKIFEKNWIYEDFAEEGRVGMISYAIERIWGYVAQDAGFKIGTVMSVGYISKKILFLQKAMEYTYNALTEAYGLHNIHEVSKLEKIKIRLKGFSQKHKQIYVFGTGQRSEDFIRFANTIDLKIHGFVVSKKSAEMFHDKKVYEISELNKKKDYGVIIAVSTKSIEMITDLLEKHGIKEYVSFLGNN
ncbi:hypothetical protein IMSAGC020_02860 [Lachnospiraceae bacterium]|nr:hypothetical protein IMSAGC020_02860 [Lachnospiraceae bacterium]